jgi:hypothetical protein
MAEKLPLKRVRLPSEIKHCLRQEDDKQHVAKDARMDDLNLPRPEFTPSAKRHGGDEMDKHA